jgi:hypothetical protein
MTQAIAFVETLCDEMTASQIANALERWELICEHHGWNESLGFEIEMQREALESPEPHGVEHIAQRVG